MPTPKEIQVQVDSQQEKINQWIQAHKSVAGTKDHLSVGPIHVLGETLVNQVNFVADMQRMQNMLIIFKNSLKPGKEKTELESYLNKINELLDAYSKFGDLTKRLNGDKPTPEEMINLIAQQYENQAFNKVMNLLGVLADSQENIDKIYRAHARDKVFKNPDYIESSTSKVVVAGNEMRQTRAFDAFTIMPVQRLPRMSMTISSLFDVLQKFQKNKPDYKLQPEQTASDTNPEIQKLITVIDKTVKKADSEVKAYNEQKGIKDVTKAAEADAKRSPAAALRQILSLNINTDLTKSAELRAGRFPLYLEKLLPLAFPQNFKTYKGELTFHGDVVEIFSALGIGLQGQITLDPARFNAYSLDSLYRQTSNPLWVVLKSTMPVSDQFTALDKVGAYLQVAQAFKDKKMGNTEKYAGAFKIVQAAASIAKEDSAALMAFQKAFGQESDIGKWILGKAKDKSQVLDVLNLQTISRAPSFVESETSSLQGEVSPPPSPIEGNEFDAVEAAFDSDNESLILENDSPKMTRTLRTRQFELAYVVNELNLSDKRRDNLLDKIQDARNGKSLDAVEKIIQSVIDQRIKYRQHSEPDNAVADKFKEYKEKISAGRKEHAEPEKYLNDEEQSAQTNLPGR